MARSPVQSRTLAPKKRRLEYVDKVCYCFFRKACMASTHHKFRSRIGELFGLKPDQLGKENEQRVVDAFSRDMLRKRKVTWIHTVRLSTEEEDRRGIDVVFGTDVGNIYVQVKSSYVAKKRFITRQENGRYRRDIAAVNLTPFKGDDEVFRIVIARIEARRKWLLHENRQRMEAELFPRVPVH